MGTCSSLISCSRSPMVLALIAAQSRRGTFQRLVPSRFVALLVRTAAKRCAGLILRYTRRLLLRGFLIA